MKKEEKVHRMVWRYLSTTWLILEERHRNTFHLHISTDEIVLGDRAEESEMDSRRK